MRFHKLQNVETSLDLLKRKKIRLVNIRNDDIVDGNPKLILGLIWTIILNFEISHDPEGQASAKANLIDWAKRATRGSVLNYSRNRPSKNLLRKLQVPLP